MLTYINYCYPYPQNYKVTLSHINRVYCLKSFCKMFHLFPVSSELFVRQTVYVYEFLVHCLTKYVEVFMQIYIILPPIIVLSKILYAMRYIVSDDLFVKVTLLKYLKRAYRFMKSLCHSHFLINVFPSRKFSTMSSLLISSHTPHCFEGVRIMFMNRPWVIHVLWWIFITHSCIVPRHTTFSNRMAS